MPPFLKICQMCGSYEEAAAYLMKKYRPAYPEYLDMLRSYWDMQDDYDED